MAENYKLLYEQMKKMLEMYQDEIVPNLRKELDKRVKLVYCKDCIHRVDGSKMCAHPKAIGWDAIEPEDDDFCSYGEKREV